MMACFGRFKCCNQSGLYLQNNKIFTPINPGNFAALNFNTNVHQFAKISSNTANEICASAGCTCSGVGIIPKNCLHNKFAEGRISLILTL